RCPYRHAGPHQGAGGGAQRPRHRALRDHDLDRATERGRHDRRRADVGGPAPQPAAARGQDHRRRLPGQDPGQRARRRAWLLHRAEGGRMSAELNGLTIAGALEGLAKKEFSATELAHAHLKAMEKHRDLNAFVVETPEKALSMAAASDARRAKGDKVGALDGISLAIKDLFCTDGVQTTAGSHILEGFKPPYESTVTANLWKAGAVMLGKVNMDEFAMGSSNLTSHFGGVGNPWQRRGKDGRGDNRRLVPGGSSGGSASAVAARMALGATATDTGGSIRQPAAFTGTVGIKPTYGRCSRWGIVAFASSL